MSRRLRAIATETVAAVELGGYQAPSGSWVDLSPAVAAAVDGTRLYLPDQALGATGAPNPSPTIEVTNESTLDAAQRLGEPVAGLVFASARNPGGGFLTGAKAQEEDIARASALHACLTSVPAFYSHHRAERDPRSSDRVIYAPDVPVFRDDKGGWFEHPYRMTMLTAAAPNLRAITDGQLAVADTVPAVLAARALRVLTVAAAHGQRRLVLGAWGCGVFGNNPATVAAAFATALRVVPHVDHVVFAILDRAPTTPTYHAFTARWAP
jgi:uncharacterized protein (TIGR02452 family)